LKIGDPRALARIELSQGLLGGYLKRPGSMAHIDRAIELSRRAGLDSELVDALFFRANNLNGAGSVDDPAVARAALLEAKAVLDRLNGTPEGSSVPPSAQEVAAVVRYRLADAAVAGRATAVSVRADRELWRRGPLRRIGAGAVSTQSFMATGRTMRAVG